MKIITHSEKETFFLGKKIAAKLKGGETIGLVGDLGAGKTALAKGIAAGLGVKQKINSPTFVLIKVYPARKGAIRHLAHADAYRLGSSKKLKDAGLGDYLGRPDSVAIVEWAEPDAKEMTAIIKIESEGSDERIFNVPDRLII